MKMKVEVGEALPLLADGVYVARLKRVDIQKDVPSNYSEGVEDLPKLFFEVAAQNLNDSEHLSTLVELSCLIPARLTIANKAGVAVSALLGRDLAVNEDIDLEKLIGKKCQIQTKTKKSSRKGGKDFSQIVDFFPTPA